MSEKIEVDTKTFVRFWLVILGMVGAAMFIYRALPGLLLVGGALFLAIAIKPLANKIDGICKKRRPALSAVLAVFLTVMVGVMALFLVGPVVVNETARFLGQFSELLRQQENGMSALNNFGQSLGIVDLQGQMAKAVSDFSAGFLANFGSTVINSLGMLSGIMTNAILLIVLTLLFLLQGPEILKKFWEILAIRDEKTTAVTKRIAEKIADVISKYVFGQVVVAILDGLVVALAVFILSLIFGFSSGLAFPLGLVAMIFYLIPMFGPFISVMLIFVLLSFNDIWAGVSFLGFYMIYTQIEGNLIAPKIQGDAMRLPSLAILVSIVIGMYMLGLVGAIVAIPIAGAIKVLVDEYPNIKALKG